MAKFIVVEKAPEKLEKGEIVIDQPTFLEQIEANARKAPKHGLTGMAHMREVLTAIAEKYDHDMNVFKMPLFRYEGRRFKTSEDLSKIFTELLHTEYPRIFDKYLEHTLKNRPLNTKLVYYVGLFKTTTPFYDAGLDLLEKKDLEAYLGTSKKVLKSAKEEADAKKEGSI